MKEDKYIINPEWENHQEWFELAGHDLDSAVILLGENGYPDIIVYHCHQCLEKLIKSLLIKQNTSFEKTGGYPEDDANYRAYKNFGVWPHGRVTEPNRYKWWEVLLGPIIIFFP